ncbi:MAG: glycosyltransferase family 4 protein [Flavobacteriales bacterium]|nr:glycosyltransferase family 4 protein [Flavobacteriales bacterium]
MKKILFLTLHRPNRSPSQRFRFEQYLQFFNNEDIEYEFSYLLNEYDDKIFYSNGKIFVKAYIVIKSFFKRLRELNQIKENDIIFIQRECFMLGTSFFERRFAKSGAKVIFDFDDSIWLQNVSEANKTFVWLKNPNKTSKIIKCSYLVIAGNEYLANYALKYNKNVVIIPTTIDTNEYYKNSSPKNDKVTIGWSGSITTIQHFEYALPFLKELKNKFGNLIEFKVIGDANYVNEDLSIKGIAWNKETEIRDLSTFDIGIMPLPDDEWANGKCGLKGLQYMALEIPTIMSPVGVNTEIIQDGVNGFLANSNEEWFAKLESLILSEDLRVKLGKAGRQTVIKKYSVVANKDYFLSLFK